IRLSAGELRSPSGIDPLATERTCSNLSTSPARVRLVRDGHALAPRLRLPANAGRRPRAALGFVWRDGCANPMLAEPGCLAARAWAPRIPTVAWTTETNSERMVNRRLKSLSNLDRWRLSTDRAAPAGPPQARPLRPKRARWDGSGAAIAQSLWLCRHGARDRTGALRPKAVRDGGSGAPHLAVAVGRVVELEHRGRTGVRAGSGGPPRSRRGRVAEVEGRGRTLALDQARPPRNCCRSHRRARAPGPNACAGSGAATLAVAVGRVGELEHCGRMPAPNQARWTSQLL